MSKALKKLLKSSNQLNLSVRAPELRLGHDGSKEDTIQENRKLQKKIECPVYL